MNVFVCAKRSKKGVEGIVKRVKIFSSLLRNGRCINSSMPASVKYDHRVDRKLRPMVIV